MRQQCECLFWKDDSTVSNQSSMRTLSGREVLKIKGIIHMEINVILQDELQIYIYNFFLIGFSNSELAAPHYPSFYFLFLLNII